MKAINTLRNFTDTILMQKFTYPLCFVFTGGPSSGKSTTISYISKKMGWSYLEESASILCLNAMKTGVNIRSNAAAFEQNIFDLQREMERTIKPNEIFLLDRSLIDSIGYARVHGIDIPGLSEMNLRARYRLVFLLDDLPFRYNAIRNSFDEDNQSAISSALQKAYQELDHEIIQVPACPLEIRAQQIINRIEKCLPANWPSGKIVSKPFQKLTP